MEKINASIEFFKMLKEKNKYYLMPVMAILFIYIFKGQMGHFMKKPICSQQYARIVKGWMKKLGIEDVSEYSTHSMRKTKPSVIYDKTHNVDAVRRLLRQSSVTATSAYLGVSDNSALELARSINI